MAAITVFDYHVLKCTAELNRCKAQARAFHLLLELGYNRQYAEHVATRMDDVRADAEMSEDDACRINAHLGAARRHRDRLYEIEQNTRLI